MLYKIGSVRQVGPRDIATAAASTVLLWLDLHEEADEQLASESFTLPALFVDVRVVKSLNGDV